MASQHKGRTKIKLLGSNFVRNVIIHTGEEVTDARRNLTGTNPVIAICILHKIYGSQIKNYEVGGTCNMQGQVRKV
jgi:hypothetical protein